MKAGAKIGIAVGIGVALVGLIWGGIALKKSSDKKKAAVASKEADVKLQGDLGDVKTADVKNLKDAAMGVKTFKDSGYKDAASNLMVIKPVGW